MASIISWGDGGGLAHGDTRARHGRYGMGVVLIFVVIWDGLGVGRSSARRREET